MRMMRTLRRASQLRSAPDKRSCPHSSFHSRPQTRPRMPRHSLGRRSMSAHPPLPFISLPLTLRPCRRPRRGLRLERRLERVRARMRLIPRGARAVPSASGGRAARARCGTIQVRSGAPCAIPSGARTSALYRASSGPALHARCSMSPRQADVQYAMPLEAAPSQQPLRSQCRLLVAARPMRVAWRAAVVGASAAAAPRPLLEVLEVLVSERAAVEAVEAPARIRRAKWVSQASCSRSLEVQKVLT